jgi:GNAT superfamily N-acetyltransferase
MMVVTGAKMTSESQVVEINRIVQLPDHFDQLLSEAAAEGLNNLSVLRDEWQDGTNRFERPGEILALATINGELAGIGGITQDFVEKDWLRMRRFYVRQHYRRLGVGRKIALFVLAYARPFHRRIALYAGGPEAEAFWPTLGFVPIDREHTTHVHGDIAW